MSLFNIDSPLMRILIKITDLVVLNVLWIICCIPVLTIGAATTALYGCFLNKSTESSVVKNYFIQFKNNFKKSTIIWLIEVVLLVVVMMNIRYYYNIGGESFSILRIFLLIPTLILGVGIEYFFPLQCHFENSIKQTIKNSFLIGLAHFPISLIILVIQVSPIILALVDIDTFFRMSPVILIIGKALIVFITSFLYKRVFGHYV